MVERRSRTGCSMAQAVRAFVEVFRRRMPQIDALVVEFSHHGRCGRDNPRRTGVDVTEGAVVFEHLARRPRNRSRLAHGEYRHVLIRVPFGVGSSTGNMLSMVTIRLSIPTAYSRRRR
jgi:hypothetical protein